MKKLNDIKDLKGQKFGRLKVLEYARPVKNRRDRLWLCQCDCGAQKTIRGDLLGVTLSCGQGFCKLSMNPKFSYPKEGDRFGMLTAIKFGYSNKKSGGLYWEFQCDCGSVRSIRWYQVKHRKIDHCGCQSVLKSVINIDKIKCTDRDSINYKNLLKRYKSGAEKRNISFQLTEKQFIHLVKSNCFYCGTPPVGTVWTRKRKVLGQPKEFKYNGIDRWFMYKGYTPENCVPCCTICNYAKRVSDGHKFLKWLVNASEHATATEANWIENKKAVEDGLLQLF